MNRSPGRHTTRVLALLAMAVTLVGLAVTCNAVR